MCKRIAALFSLVTAACSRVAARTPATASKIVWEDCGGAAASLRFRSFEMSVPQVPGTLNFYIDAVSNEVLEHLTLQTEFSWQVSWFGFGAGRRKSFPCENNVGSCLYEDICGMLSHMKTSNGNVCPQEMQNVGLVENCTCPFQPGRVQGYFSINLPALSKQYSQITTGNWTVRGSLFNQARRLIGCVSCAFNWDSFIDYNDRSTNYRNKIL